MDLVERKSDLIDFIVDSTTNLPVSRIEVHRALVEDVVVKPLVKPNLAWLDYCGPFSRNKMAAILRTCEMVKERKGIAAFTVAACRESNEVKDLFDLWVDQPFSSSIVLQVRNHLSKYDALSLPILSRELVLSQSSLNPIVQKELVGTGFAPFELDGLTQPVWTTTLVSAREYLVRSSNERGLPTSLYRRVRAISKALSERMGPLDITVQPYADTIPMMFFLFNFTSTVRRNRVKILPYLKG